MKKNCKKCNCEFEFMDKNSFFSNIIHQWLCKKCKIDLDYDFEAFKNKFLQTKNSIIDDDHIFPPPWDFTKHPEKTEGWLEFQKEMKKHPAYYLGKYA